MKISQEKVSLNFKEHLDNGNLWCLPFSLFNGFIASCFKPKILVLIWSYSKCFGVRWRGFKRKTQAYVALGVNFFMRNNWFCILVRYCNIVTPILKSKISLLRLIAEELWDIRRSFSIFIGRFATNVNGCIVHWKNISADKNFFRFSYRQFQFRSVYQCMTAGMKRC